MLFAFCRCYEVSKINVSQKNAVVISMGSKGGRPFDQIAKEKAFHNSVFLVQFYGGNIFEEKREYKRI